MTKSLKKVLEQEDIHDEFEDLQPGEEQAGVKLDKDQKDVVESKKLKKEAEEDDTEEKNEEVEMSNSDNSDLDDGKYDTNQGKSGGDEEITESEEDDSEEEKFEKKLKKEARRILAKESSDSDDEEEKNEAEGDDEEKKDETKKLKKESKKSAKKESEEDKDDIDLDEDDDEEKKDETKKLKKEAEEEDKEEDEDEDLKESLTAKEQEIVMEALKLPKSARSDLVTIFESMVARKGKENRAKIVAQYERKAEKMKLELVENIDLFAKNFIAKWKMENKPVFDKIKEYETLKENFAKLTGIFKEVGLSAVLTESKIGEKYTELSKQNVNLLERNKELEAQIEKTQVREIYESYLGKLSNNQKRKFIGLAESLEFENVVDLKKKLNAINKLFVESKKKYEDDEIDVDLNNESEEEEENNEGLLVKESRSYDLVSESMKVLSGK